MLKTKSRFKDLLPELTEEEFAELEKDILEHGIRDPIRILKGDVIMDGHHRYSLAKKHGLKYDVQVMDMDDDQAEQWIIRNQLGRRNLTREQMSYFRGKLYQSLKKPHGGDRKSSDQNDNLIPSGGGTDDTVSAITGASPATVRRDDFKAAILDRLPSAIRKQHLAGKLTATAGELEVLAGLEGNLQTKIAREVRVGTYPNLSAALKSNGKAPRKGKAKCAASPPKKLDRPAYFKQWENAIGPIVRLVDKIASGVGESRNGHHKDVQEHLNDATETMKEWMEVE